MRAAGEEQLCARLPSINGHHGLHCLNVDQNQLLALDEGRYSFVLLPGNTHFARLAAGRTAAAQLIADFAEVLAAPIAPTATFAVRDRLEKFK